MTTYLLVLSIMTFQGHFEQSTVATYYSPVACQEAKQPFKVLIKAMDTSKVKRATLRCHELTTTKVRM